MINNRRGHHALKSSCRNIKRFGLIGIMVVSMLMTGCMAQNGNTSGAGNTTAGQTNGTGQTSPASTGSVEGQGFPLKVTDGNGYEMTVESRPQRIISLTLGSDEMLLGLVDKSRILAITQYAVDAGISNVTADVAGIDQVTMDNIENIIAKGPDLVIVDTWADANEVKQMRDSGITVYAFRTPCNIEEQKATILELAHITGDDEKGQEIVSWMDSKLKEVEERLSALKPESRLTVMDYGEMGSSGLGTNYDDIVTRAGLVNVVSRAGMDGWPTVSKEKIIELNPDIITLPSWFYDEKNTLESMKNVLITDESLQTVNAIKNQRFISIPNPHISAISQYVVLGVEDMAKAAYPELFQ